MPPSYSSFKLLVMIAFVILIAFVFVLIVASFLKLFDKDVINDNNSEGCLWLVGIIVGIFSAAVFSGIIKSMIVD